MQRDVAIIGAGPAGLIAAEQLALAGFAVTVYERMPSPARKLLMAGRGGLNLTHSEPLDRFVERYGTMSDWIEPLVRNYPPAMLRSWCEGLGEPVFVGTSGRVFPRSLKASPLLRAWLARLAGMGVRILTRHRLVGISAGPILAIEDPAGSLLEIQPTAALLALGGASWPRLGSDGSWVEMLGRVGVDVAPLLPANTGIEIAWSDHFRTRYEGQPLKRIAAGVGGSSVRGEAVITRTGLEGGVIYALGPLLRRALAEHRPLLLDLRPDLELGVLEQRLAARRPKETITNHLRKAGGLRPIAIGLLREAGQGRLPDDPREIAALIKALPLPLAGLGSLDRAISTAGGVAVDGLDARMMLRRMPGFFVAGEMLDWEGPTGGYLLQGCFATGVAAAHGIQDWTARQN